MQVRLQTTNAAASTQLQQWVDTYRRQLHRVAEQVLNQEARDLKPAVQQHVAGQLQVVKKGFLKSFTVKALTKHPTRLPALYVGSKIPWSGIHEHGGTLAGKMLIPLHGRVGRKRFKAQITALIRGGNAYFVKTARGQVVVMAENLPEHSPILSGFKRRYRQAAGLKRLKRGTDIPIAVLVPKVVLRKRLAIEQLVRARLPVLSSQLSKQLQRIN